MVPVYNITVNFPTILLTPTYCFVSVVSGLRPCEFYGNFNMNNTTDVELALVNAQTVIIYQWFHWHVCLNSVATVSETVIDCMCQVLRSGTAKIIRIQTWNQQYLYAHCFNNIFMHRKNRRHVPRIRHNKKLCMYNIHIFSQRASLLFIIFMHIITFKQC